MIFIITSFSLLFGVLLYIVAVWNKIVSRKNRIDQAYGSIDVYLKERFDLLPNLISTLQRYMEHENELLTRVTALRTQTRNGGTQTAMVDAANELESLSASLSFENYPNLKSDAQFIRFQQTLSDTEAKLAASRRTYNATVTAYNTFIESFPTSVIARVRKDTKKPLFEAVEEEKKPIDASLLFKLKR